MNTVHSIKVEMDTLNMKLQCHLCDFGTRNMSEYKKHLINEHKKEEHNWMVDAVKCTFNCDECKTEFPDKALLANHIKNIHKEDGENITNQIMSCDQCGKQVPNDQKAMMLHMSREHNENLVKYTPGPNKTLNQYLECEACEFKGRSKPSLLKQQERMMHLMMTQLLTQMMTKINLK